MDTWPNGEVVAEASVEALQLVSVSQAEVLYTEQVEAEVAQAAIMALETMEAQAEYGVVSTQAEVEQAEIKVMVAVGLMDSLEHLVIMDAEMAAAEDAVPMVAEQAVTVE
jgi:hypothetical protein